MRTENRRSAPKVKAGKVQHKNNQSYTGNYFDAEMPWLVIDRKRPGAGYKHLLGADQIRTFLRLVPHWKTFDGWLEAVVLEPGNDDYWGCHWPGVIAICAWPRDITYYMSLAGFEKDKPLLDMLEVPYIVDAKHNRVECQFTEATARGHQLLGTFLHEIGHHIDRLTTGPKIKACRGEPFAEKYAIDTARQIFDSYTRVFGL